MSQKPSQEHLHAVAEDAKQKVIASRRPWYHVDWSVVSDLQQKVYLTILLKSRYQTVAKIRQSIPGNKTCISVKTPTKPPVNVTMTIKITRTSKTVNHCPKI